MKNVQHGSSLESDPGFDQHVAIAQLLLHNIRDLRSCGLCAHDYDLMLALKAVRRGQHRTLSQLASRIDADAATCASALRQLGRRGLVRTGSLSPHRSRCPRLTLKGEALLHRLSRRDRARWLRLAPALLSSLRHPEDLQ